MARVPLLERALEHCILHQSTLPGLPVHLSCVRITAWWHPGVQQVSAAPPIALPAPFHAAVQRYALKQAAARQDRGYLHCAALRFMLRGRPVQVVCPPQHGQHFGAPPFQQLFTGWFPPGMEEDLGVWFEDSKLLRSGPLDAEETAGGGALDWQW